MTEAVQVGAVLRAAGARLAAGDFRGAHAACMQVLAVDPASAEAFYLLGIVGAAHGNHVRACELFGRSIALSPGVGRYHAEQARSLVALSRKPEALEEVALAAACRGLEARTLDTIGVVYSRCGLHAEAVPFYERATAMDGRRAAYWYNLGASLQFIGEFGRAHEAYAAAIRLEPGNVRAWSSMILMSRQRDREHVAHLGALFEVTEDADERLHLGHALAKIYEDTGAPAEAMEWLARAKEARRREADLDPVRMREPFLAAAATLATQAAGSGCDDASPIFIVGLPRTGTTLADRILSAHSRIVSAGELSDFAVLLKRRTGTPSPFVLDAETLRQGAVGDLAGVGEEYIRRARDVAGVSPRFIDKMPLNVFYSALILRALPNARVICLRRDPVDTVLSNYRQLFATGFSYYAYAFDLEAAARYYVEFDRLVRAFREGLPSDRYMEVRYEDIVANLEGEARRLVSFCGEDWEPRCLDFHENSAPVATASSGQVRQPLYATSVGRWRAYRDHLGPVFEVFRSEGVAFDGDGHPKA